MEEEIMRRAAAAPSSGNDKLRRLRERFAEIGKVHGAISVNWALDELDGIGCLLAEPSEPAKPAQWAFVDELRKFLIADKKRAQEAIAAAGNDAGDGPRMWLRVVENVICRMELLAISMQTGGEPSEPAAADGELLRAAEKVLDYADRGILGHPEKQALRAAIAKARQGQR